MHINRKISKCRIQIPVPSQPLLFHVTLPQSPHLYSTGTKQVISKVPSSMSLISAEKPMEWPYKMSGTGWIASILLQSWSCPCVLFVKVFPSLLLEGTPSFLHLWLTTDICQSWHSLIPTFLSYFPMCSIYHLDFLVPLLLLTFSESEKRQSL